jgi:hypothetical protein
MKTYILRDPKSVEPQVARFVAAPDPQTAARVERIVATGRGPALYYVGLDVHTDSIAVSLAPSDSAEVRRPDVMKRHAQGLTVWVCPTQNTPDTRTGGVCPWGDGSGGEGGSEGKAGPPNRVVRGVREGGDAWPAGRRGGPRGWALGGRQDKP